MFYMLFPSISKTNFSNRTSFYQIRCIKNNTLHPLPYGGLQCIIVLLNYQVGTTTGKYDILPSFQSQFLENMGVVLYNKGYQMIELFILLQLVQVLTPGSILINFYEDQNKVGLRTSISHK